MENSLLYQVALSKIHKVGPVLAKILISYCGNSQDVFRAKESSLSKIPSIGPAIIKELKGKSIFEKAEKEIEFCIKNDVDILYYLDEKYPRRLKHFEYSPVILYYKGNGNLNTDRTVGIIGTRQPTTQGKIITEKFVEDLQPLGATIVSGLAFGVDGIAHKKSVEFNIPTIGVLGHGLDIIYPAEHSHLSKKMIKNGGLLTEFGIETKPDRQNFPMRNRIIAALSDAIIVIESKSRGGSIITAEYANEYNKDVFAVPGKPGDEFSAGCNGLIKRTKALLIEDINDLKYIMRWDDLDKEKVVQTSLFVDLTEEENAVVNSIREAKEISIDELSYMHQATTSSMSSMLLTLEFKGVVRTLPGKRYMVN